VRPRNPAFLQPSTTYSLTLGRNCVSIAFRNEVKRFELVNDRDKGDKVNES